MVYTIWSAIDWPLIYGVAKVPNQLLSTLAAQRWQLSSWVADLPDS